MAELKLLCFGSRQWDDLTGLQEVLRPIFERTTKRGVLLIHGGQRSSDASHFFGADYQWAEAGRHFAFKIQSFPVDWIQAHKDLGKDWKSAGPKRNTRMLEEEPDLAYVAHDDPAFGRGSRDMLTKLLDAGIPTIWHRHKPGTLEMDMPVFANLESRINELTEGSDHE